MASAILPIISGLAGAGAGAAQGQNQAQQIAQNYALNKRGQALQEGLNANALERQTQTNPLRDQAIYNLSGMLGAAPAAFNPTSMLSPTNSGPQGIGGVNQNALANYQGQYTPGAGNVTSNVQQMIMNRLGYGNVKTGTLFDNPTTPADTLTNSPTAASTTGAANKGGAGVTPPDPYSAGQNAGYSNPSQSGSGGGSSQSPTNPGGGPLLQNPSPSTGVLNAAPLQTYTPPAPSAQALGVASPAIPTAGAPAGMSAQQAALMKMLGMQGGLGAAAGAGMMAGV